jgi:hypothetical protein
MASFNKNNDELVQHQIQLNNELQKMELLNTEIEKLNSIVNLQEPEEKITQEQY